ncbi:MAG: hypothetical protein ACI92B_001303, partial [Marinobacter maritimus]
RRYRGWPSRGIGRNKTLLDGYQIIDLKQLPLPNYFVPSAQLALSGHPSRFSFCGDQDGKQTHCPV